MSTGKNTARRGRPVQISFSWEIWWKGGKKEAYELKDTWIHMKGIPPTWCHSKVLLKQQLALAQLMK